MHWDSGLERLRKDMTIQHATCAAAFALIITGLTVLAFIGILVLGALVNTCEAVIKVWTDGRLYGCH